MFTNSISHFQNSLETATTWAYAGLAMGRASVRVHVNMGTTGSTTYELSTTFLRNLFITKTSGQAFCIGTLAV